MYYQKAYVVFGLVAQAKSDSNICIINDKRQTDSSTHQLLHEVGINVGLLQKLLDTAQPYFQQWKGEWGCWKSK